MNKCISCGSVAKLKVCCNSCYQELKSKAEKLDKLEKWLDSESLFCNNSIKENELNNGYAFNGMQRARLSFLKEVREVL